MLITLWQFSGFSDSVPIYNPTSTNLASTMADVEVKHEEPVEEVRPAEEEGNEEVGANTIHSLWRVNDQQETESDKRWRK